MNRLLFYLLLFPFTLLAENDPKKLYEKDYNAKLSDRVTGRAVIQGIITKAEQRAYCPLRTAKCGHNPTCSHPKKNMNIYEIRGEKSIMHKGLIGSSKVFKNVNDFNGQNYQEGDGVYFFIVGYKDGRVSQPFKIKPVKTGAAPQEPGEGK